MAGIYFHIPFCKQACHYCDFHFSTSLKYKNEIVDGLLNELSLRSNYLNGQPIQSIYFGGGTPSILSPDELNRLLDRTAALYSLSADTEITLEANPDDITSDATRDWKALGINRLSIGIQSFHDEDLRYMNRSHDAVQAADCVKIAKDMGFEHLSIDLIFGYPLLTDLKWQQNIDEALALHPTHLSCYAMTVETNTALWSFIQKKNALPMDGEQSARQFEYLMERMHHAGYEHYEISNYALPGHRAIHNSNYWKRVPYLGIGPSAHSFDGLSRQWNVSNNAHYIKALQAGDLPFEKEVLSEWQQLNETIMTSLRTSEGLNFNEVLSRLNPTQTIDFMEQVIHYEELQMLNRESNVLVLSTKGKLYADAIASDLFINASSNDVR
jgi:oxygen-independent coproporphyrinogen-3 oxidase